ncbi:MAG: transcription termination/antitermination protein NusA [Chloroflexi bacterium]|nr:transcription termination/antitermination protein NusA [Chloroflexota bacterium]
MKSDFLLAITQLSAEKNLPKEVILGAVEAALVSAYRKEHFTPNQDIAVKINPGTGKVEVWAGKTVVERPVDSRTEISPDEARRIKPDAQPGEVIMVESTPHNAGRIAAQTAKQVIMQRLHEAEHTAIYDEYTSKEGDVLSGVIQRIEAAQAYVDLGRVEAVLPASEQVRIERYRVGQRLKVLVLQVQRTPKGPRVIISRSHPNLLRRLFELEVPEVFNGTVQIKAVSREAGFRSKVAVASRQEGVDPVGCCIGLRGIRIQNIVNELHGEKIDVIQWHPDPAMFIASALSPARIVSVELDKEAETAVVVVPDKQLSLAIGREGQNARLAAKLTGWRIDIKSSSAIEAERMARAAAPAAEVPAEPVAVEPVPAAREEPVPAAVAAVAPPVEAPSATEITLEAEEPQVAEVEIVEEEEGEEFIPEVIEEPVIADDRPQIRFAEDIMVPRGKGPDRRKKKKKVVAGKESEEGAKARKGRRDTGVRVDDYEF